MHVGCGTQRTVTLPPRHYCAPPLHRKTRSTCTCPVPRAAPLGVLSRAWKRQGFPVWSPHTWRRDSLGPLAARRRFHAASATNHGHSRHHGRSLPCRHDQCGHVRGGTPPHRRPLCDVLRAFLGAMGSEGGSARLAAARSLGRSRSRRPRCHTRMLSFCDMATSYCLACLPSSALTRECSHCLLLAHLAAIALPLLAMLGERGSPGVGGQRVLLANDRGPWFVPADERQLESDRHGSTRGRPGAGGGF